MSNAKPYDDEPGGGPHNDPSFMPFPASKLQMRELVDMLRKREEAPQGRFTRQAPRYEIGPQSLPMMAEHIGGGEIKCYIGVFDISAGGLGAIHRGFLHVNTRLRIWLPKRGGGTVAVEGVVRWCDHLSNRYHAVGVGFKDLIDPKPFVDPAEWLNVRQSAASAPEIEITGAAMVYERNQLLERLVIAALSRSGLDVTRAESGGDLLDAIKKRPLDLLVVGGVDEDSNESLQDIVGKLRIEGYRGVLLHLSPHTGEHYAREAAEAGVDHLLATPFKPETLVTTVRSLLLERADTLAGSAPIYPEGDSTFNASILGEYIESVQREVERIAKYMKDDDFTRMRSLAMGIMSSGEGFGFSPLTEAARRTITRLDATGSVQESAAEVQQLRHVVTRLRIRPAA